MLGLARLSIARPRVALIAWGAVAVLLSAVGLGVAHSLSPSATVVAGTESSRAAHLANAQAEVDETNKRFARAEQVKRFAILGRELTQASGELTPTMKIKRAVVYERYARFFDELYSEEQ